MLKHRLLIGVLALALLGLQARLWLGEGGAGHVAELSQRLARLQAENQVQGRRNALLRAEIHSLKGGLDAVEDLARSELGMIKKGETFFLLAED